MAISPTQSLNYFDSLPDEKVLEIASYLSIEDVGRFAQVCKRFNTISNDDQFWRLFAQREEITIDPKQPREEVKTYYKIKGKNSNLDLYATFARFLGPTAFLNLPICVGKDAPLTPADMSAPIMKGVDQTHRPYVALCYSSSDEYPMRGAPGEKLVTIFYQSPLEIRAVDRNYGNFAFNLLNYELLNRIKELLQKKEATYFNWITNERHKVIID